VISSAVSPFYAVVIKIALSFHALRVGKLTQCLRRTVRDAIGIGAQFVFFPLCALSRGAQID